MYSLQTTLTIFFPPPHLLNSLPSSCPSSLTYSVTLFSLHFLFSLSPLSVFFPSALFHLFLFPHPLPLLFFALFHPFLLPHPPISQMIHLLDAMGLKQHHETFMKERISGEILVECDDQVLEKELKVGVTKYCFSITFTCLPLFPCSPNLCFKEIYPCCP